MILKSIYNRLIRDRLPRKIGVFNGVAVRDIGLFDRTDVFPDYEEVLMDGIRTEVREGDDCVLVGGGRGVSSVVAARQVGNDGSVSTFEADSRSAELVSETSELNGVGERVAVENTVVGSSGRLWSGSASRNQTEPDELPDGDVLILDCNGAELELLEAITLSFRTLFVRINGFQGVSGKDVRSIIEENGFTVSRFEMEHPPKGVKLITARNCKR